MGKVIVYILVIVALMLLLSTASIAQVHTVAKGDTINKLGQAYEVDQHALCYANNLRTSVIYPGQQLNIPERYTVQKGDTLNLIGKKFGVTYQNILDANQINNSYIYPGQILYIPLKHVTQKTDVHMYRDNYNVSRGGIGNSDFDLLARIITAEADSESYATQVAVGATVLNRVKNKHFPNSIRGVVYQVDKGGRYQFEPVLNGWINNPPSESGKKAALEALSGSDPTNGALYFFETWVTNKFLKSRPVSKFMDAFAFSF